MEVMGLMLGAVDHVFQTNMLDMLKQTDWEVFGYLLDFVAYSRVV